MTMTFKCLRCGKRFYIPPKDEELFNTYSDAALRLRLAGYKGAHGTVWRILEDRAKCCKDPDISLDTWEP